MEKILIADSIRQVKQNNSKYEKKCSKKLICKRFEIKRYFSI